MVGGEPPISVPKDAQVTTFKAVLQASTFPADPAVEYPCEVTAAMDNEKVVVTYRLANQTKLPLTTAIREEKSRHFLDNPRVVYPRSDGILRIDFIEEWIERLDYPLRGYDEIEIYLKRGERTVIPSGQEIVVTITLRFPIWLWGPIWSQGQAADRTSEDTVLRRQNLAGTSLTFEVAVDLHGNLGIDHVLSLRRRGFAEFTKE